LTGIIGIVLFLIGIALNPLLNLISADLADWHSEHRTLTWILTIALIGAGTVLSSGVVLSPLLNLISTDLANWYLEHHTLTWIFITLIVGVVLLFISVWPLSKRRESAMGAEGVVETTSQAHLKSVLLYLHRKVTSEPVSLTELCTKFNASPEDIREVVNELYDKSFVKVTALGSDAMLCEITHKGRRITKDFETDE